MIGIAPPFLAFGITLTIHLPLCCGVTSILNFNPDPGSSVELFAKKKPNHFLGGVIHVRKLMESPLCKKINLSKLRTIAIGGESLSPTQCVEVNEFLRGHGAPTQLITGYGMTELSSTVSTEKDGACKIGSIGIPQCKAIVKVVDTETQEELPYKAVGELHFSSPSAMVGYLNNADETNATLYSDPQGTKWVRTGDLGYIDEDGFVFIVGRIKRIFLTYSPQTSQAFKLFPSYIENEIEKCSFVDRCAVVVVPHSEFMNVPVAFVSLKDKVANAEDIINQQLSLAIAEYNLPYKYYFVDRFPFLASGKIDYRALEKEIKI